MYRYQCYLITRDLRSAFLRRDSARHVRWWRMPISSTPAVNNALSAGSSSGRNDSNAAFRDADFMKILLAEITQQDPMQPQETSKIVEGMQKIQELANSRFEKFRDDQRWARDLAGQSVTVQQVQVDPGELTKLRERGLDPDIGYGSISGVVERYRVVDERVWVHANGKDYPIDNIRQVNPPAPGGEQLGTVAAGMLGRIVQYRSEDGTTSTEGLVGAVGFGSAGGVVLTIGDEQVPVSRVQRIRM